MSAKREKPEIDPSEVDLHSLLSAALDRPTPPDLADRVTARIALMETVVEFTRLLGIAPASAASDAVRKDEDEEPDDG